MHITKTLACAVIAAATITVTSTMSGPAMAAGDEAIIEQRIKLMKQTSKAFKVVKKFVKSGEGTAADVAASAQKVSMYAGKMVELFPKGTHRGAYDEKTTRALPKIWEDWNGFKAAADVLATESAKLAKIAAMGDAGAIAAQFGATGKKGCGGCHKPFRGAKVK